MDMSTYGVYVEIHYHHFWPLYENFKHGFYTWYKVSGSHPRLMEYGLDDDASGTVMITIMLCPGDSVRLVAW